MDIFYRKGILYFTTAISIINITKILGIGYKLTEKEAVYLLYMPIESFFDFSYNTSQMILVIIMFSLTVWLFFFYLDINIMNRRRGI